MKINDDDHGGGGTVNSCLLLTVQVQPVIQTHGS